ncbi:MAG: hypothetical protein KAS66_03360 [Candidatus Omnitrophica bacterium]|nr:hypothetical protein [Candidatus Omnitrophota bacterium]
MKVKKLITELKKLPQNLEVGVAMHDNNENEVAGWVFSVNEIVEDLSEYYSTETKEGERCVLLSC